MKQNQNHLLKKISLFIMVFIMSIIMLLLGFWQLHRAQEKQLLINISTHEAKQEPFAWKKGQSNPRAYQKIKLFGHYDQRYFLLDNQYYNHVWGYHIISPFWIDDTNLVMVDRGWIAGDPLRENFPKIEYTPGEQMINGQVFYNFDQRFLREVKPIAVDFKNTQVWLLADLSVSKMEKCLNHSVLPWVVRLSPNDPHGWIRSWPVVNMRPDQHRAYAVQWFGLATCVLLAYLYFLFKHKW